jgi:hypothetical protein
MNPLDWKREHQLALLCAVALGCFFGAIVGFRVVGDVGYSTHWMLYCAFGTDYRAGRWYNCTYLTPGYWLLIALLAALGGFICAILIYIWQLLRA